MNEENKAVTLEDLHGEITEEEAWTLHERRACEIFGYHRAGCPMRTYKDTKVEFEAELVINGN